MFRNFVKACAVLFLLPVLLLAQDGKLRGKVTDKESGEPLIGANIAIDGTNLGASSDVNGEYVVLSMPAGVYTVKASYVGYAATTVSNVRVNSAQTTSLDFTLSNIAVQAKEVMIIADRPLIQRNTTNTVRMNTQENIRNIPVRGLQNIVALEAGVVQQNGELYVRGGRAREVSYYVEGVSVTNPLFRSENINVIQEALEEFQLQSGGYTAEFGGAAAGIVRSTFRTGSSSLKATVDFQTDDFAKPGATWMGGTTSFGYRNAVATISGPITSNAHFFVAGQHNFDRNRRKMFLEPFTFTGLVTDDLGSRPAGAGEALPGPLEFKRNYLYNNWNLTNTIQGNLSLDFSPLKFRLAGSYEANSLPTGGDWPGALQFYYNQKKNIMNDTKRTFLNARVTHVLSSSTFYEVGVSWQRRFATSYDPDFKENWMSYTDSSANAALGYTGFRSRWAGPYSYSVIQNFTFTDPSAPNTGYSKNLQQSVGFTVDFTSQMNVNWELKGGGSLEKWTSRNYNVGNIQGLMQYLDPGNTGTPSRSFVSDHEKRVKYIQQGGMNNWGYDIMGNEIESGYDAPRKPLFASAYFQNKFEYHDLVLNLGLRYEYMDGDAMGLGKDAMENPIIDTTVTTIIDESQLVKRDPVSLVLPRISFSFPVTDKTVFYALYGKYAQFPRLDQMYISSVQASTELVPSQRTPYWIGGNLLGYTLNPERNTQYEVGIRQQLAENFALTLTGFYKDLTDQIQVRRVYNDRGSPYTVALANEDFGTVKGVEVTLELRRTNRLSAKVNYTLSDARGTSSNNTSSSYSVSDEVSARFPMFINPLDFNQTHRGAISVDYRFGKGDGGPILEGFGINAVMTFNSGHNYTKVAEPANLGQATAWNVGVRATIDNRSRNPVEPINSSVTPWVFNVDLNMSKMLYLGPLSLEVYVNVLNVLNTKSVTNVYPTTGTATDDGWLKSPLAAQYRAIPGYEAFYKAVNLNNRWAWMGGGRPDLYGAPRQFRVGMRIEI